MSSIWAGVHAPTRHAAHSRYKLAMFQALVSSRARRIHLFDPYYHYILKQTPGSLHPFQECLRYTSLGWCARAQVAANVNSLYPPPAPWDPTRELWDCKTAFVPLPASTNTGTTTTVKSEHWLHIHWGRGLWGISRLRGTYTVFSGMQYHYTTHKLETRS